MKFNRQLIRTASLLPLVCLVALGNDPCDLDRDGSLTFSDVQFARQMALGTRPCTAAVHGYLVCDSVVVQRVINAMLGSACVANGVAISWTPSPSAEVTGYYIYRAESSAGPYVRLNGHQVQGASFLDTTAVPGRTYYYTVTAVASDIESNYSNMIRFEMPAR